MQAQMSDNSAGGRAVFKISSEAEAAAREAELTASLDRANLYTCLLYTSPSPRDQRGSRMPSSA